MKKVTIILLLLVAIGSLGLVGCSSKKSTEEAATLRVGLNAQFPPFESVGGPNGEEFYGFDIDLIYEVAAQLGKEIEIVDMDFDGLIPALNSGKVDLCISGMTITEDRKKNVNFSDPYYTATQVVLVQKGMVDTYSSVADLKDGATIGAVLGYTGEIIAQDLFAPEQIATYKSGFEASIEVSNGRIDALIMDSAPAVVFAQKQGLAIANIDFDPEYYGIAISKDNPELLAEVNEALATIIPSTQYQDWIATHIE